MYNSQRMNFVDSITNLIHNKCNSSLRKRLRFFKLVVELSSSSHLQNNINVGNVIETTIHLDYVWMVQIHLNFDFSYELLGDLFLVEQLFLNYF